MKKILPVLLCYVLSASQTYALSGGPVFTSGVSPIGTYSGVIEGVSETDDTVASGPAIPGDPTGPTNNSTTTASNALGLFDLSVPTIGLATGTFILFEDGIVFTGTINASADPEHAKLLGILEATFNLNTAVTASAVGKINAKVGAANFGSASLGRLTGTANLDVSFGTVDATTLQPIIARSSTFNVIGFKQSSAAGVAAAAGAAG